MPEFDERIDSFGEHTDQNANSIGNASKREREITDTNQEYESGCNVNARMKGYENAAFSHDPLDGAIHINSDATSDLNSDVHFLSNIARSIIHKTNSNNTTDAVANDGLGKQINSGYEFENYLSVSQNNQEIGLGTHEGLRSLASDSGARDHHLPAGAVTTCPPASGPVPGLYHQVAGALAGSLIHFALGAIVGLTGVIYPALTDPNTKDLLLDTEQAALFSSLLNIGAMVGSLASGPLMVWLGQRVTLLVALPVAAAGWFLLAFAPAIWVMQVSRILLGVITGIFGGPSANYVAEITHSSIRGRLTGLIDLFRQFGFLFVYVVGSSGLSWRHTSIVCGCVTTVIPFMALWLLPNSPRWLATKSRVSEARRSLKFYRADDKNIEHELDDINKQLEQSSRGSNVKSQFQNMKDPSVFKRMVFLVFMFFAYQFTGNFSMIVFSVTIFQSTQSNLDEYTSTIIVGCVRVIGVGVYIAMADRVGRRVLLLSSLVLSSVAIAILGLFFFLVFKEVDVTSFDWLPLLSTATFIFFTCIAEPALILIRAELLPTSVRSLGVSIIYVFFFTGAFLVSYLYPFMVSTMGSHGVFWTYAVDGILMAVVGALFIPETKAKTLEDIDESYRKEAETEKEDNDKA